MKPVREATLLRAIAELFGESRPLAAPAPVIDRPKLKGHVLIAEDNPTNQKVIEMRMTRLGCFVDVASNGMEAVQAADSTEYDLILMDCQMPVMDGFQATRVIRAGQRGPYRVPIIALTANAMEGERERCLEAGMDDYLAKPVRPDDLLAKLRKWLSLEAQPASQAPVSHELREQFEAFVEELREGGISQEDIDSLLLKFLETTTPMLEQLAESIRRQEAQPACFAAHTLKGSFATVGLRDLSKAIGAVEQDCKAQRWQNAMDAMTYARSLFEEAQGLISGALHSAVDAA